MLERFDGAGQFRLTENGQPIDVKGELNGKSFAGASGLGRYLHDSPQASGCVVRNLHYYGQGRAVDYRDSAYLTAQTQEFGESGYRLPALYRRIASSPEFFKVVPPIPAPASSGDSQ
jgi:hypothetical protein